METKQVKKAKHTVAGTPMTGADAIIQLLADEGVDTVFGYNGGAILPAYDAIFRYNASRPASEQIALVVPANEQGAGFMASGYARATGKVGVFMVTSGPGATNCTTPVQDCKADSIPLVLISGQVARALIGTDAFQEAPIYNIMSACAKHVFLVSDETKLEATLRTAFAIARSGRPGPVVVDVPKDVQNHVQPYAGSGMLEFKGYDRRIRQLQESRLTGRDIEEFYRLLAKSHRPLLYAGGGVIASNAAPELRMMSEKFHIPVVTTLLGIGSVDTTAELSLHMLGMHGTPYANYAIQDCDFLIAVGARFDDRVVGNVAEFARHAKVAHIDIDAAEISKIRRADWYHVGDAKTALQDLLGAAVEFKRDFSKWVKHVVRLKREHPLDYDRNAAQIQPPEVLRAMNELVRGDAIICTGVGQHQMWAAQYIDFHQPRSFITSGSMGTMGFGLPASVGAKLGRPDKIVIDVDGDGSLRMNIGELETAVTYDVAIKVLLINNRGDGMPLQWQRLYFGQRFSGTDKMQRTWDFVKVAEAGGFAYAKRVSDRADLRKRLEEFLACDKPAFLDVLVDQDANVYPMIGPGQPYTEMITGPYIAPRGAGLPHVAEDQGDLF